MTIQELNTRWNEEKEKLNKKANTINGATEIMEEAKTKWGNDILTLEDAISNLARLEALK